jgi:hypothetical protein
VGGGGGRPLLPTLRVLSLLNIRSGYYLHLELEISTKMKSTINEKGAYLTGLNSEIYEVNMSGV